ncbi:MAG: hypothetical protein ABJE47_03420 [bacterium]
MSLPPIVFGTMRDHYLLLFSVAGAVALCAGFVGSWVGGYLGGLRAARAAQLDAGQQSRASVDLAPMMHALDAISLEVERISEAQRFTARVLSDRQPSMLPRAEQRSITPH